MLAPPSPAAKRTDGDGSRCDSAWAAPLRRVANAAWRFFLLRPAVHWLFLKYCWVLGDCAPVCTCSGRVSGWGAGPEDQDAGPGWSPCGRSGTWPRLRTCRARHSAAPPPVPQTHHEREAGRRARKYKLDEHDHRSLRPSLGCVVTPPWSQVGPDARPARSREWPLWARAHAVRRCGKWSLISLLLCSAEDRPDQAPPPVPPGDHSCGYPGQKTKNSKRMGTCPIWLIWGCRPRIGSLSAFHMISPNRNLTRGATGSLCWASLTGLSRDELEKVGPSPVVHSDEMMAVD